MSSVYACSDIRVSKWLPRRLISRVAETEGRDWLIPAPPHHYPCPQAESKLLVSMVFPDVASTFPLSTTASITCIHPSIPTTLVSGMNISKNEQAFSCPQSLVSSDWSVLSHHPHLTNSYQPSKTQHKQLLPSDLSWFPPSRVILFWGP